MEKISVVSILILCSNLFATDSNDANGIQALNIKIEKMKNTIIKLRQENEELLHACRIHNINTKNYSKTDDDGINIVPVMPEFCDKFSIGKVAFVRSARILQILDDGFLAYICYTVQVENPPTESGPKIIDHIGEISISSLYISRGSHFEERESPLIFIKGINSTADNEQIHIDVPLRVAGTKKYTNAIGSVKTVFVLEPIKWSDVLTVKSAK